MKCRKTKIIHFILIPMATIIALSAESFAKDEAPSPAASVAPDAAAPAAATGAAKEPGDDAEKVNVDNIKEKYWARGDKSEMGVVQNRSYTKEGKWEIAPFGGFILTDPFLNVNNVGLTLGYHFSEYFAIDAVYWKSFAGNSSALNTLQSTEGGTANYNKPEAYYGAEAQWSLLYGKLSVMGDSIIYFDMFFLLGGGMTQTQNGTYPTPELGLGQQVYLTKSLSIKLDYRMMYYHEDITQHAGTPSEIGQVIGSRNNFSNVIDLGFSFMFGGSGK